MVLLLTINTVSTMQKSFANISKESLCCKVKTHVDQVLHTTQLDTLLHHINKELQSGQINNMVNCHAKGPRKLIAPKTKAPILAASSGTAVSSESPVT